jgi:iron(III)-enterobactin esterase
VCSHPSDSSSNLIDSLCNRIAYRQILESDIPEVIGFLVPTGSNSRSVGKIPASDVNPDSIRARLQSGHSGWVAWANRSLIGFSMANRTNGEVWAMAIAPEWEGKDIDRELMRQTEAWLFSHGWAEIWAAMPPEENAPGFCNGPAWQDWKRERDRCIKKADVQSVLRLEEHAFTGPTTGYQRLVRLQRGPSDRIHRLCMLLDGETYWRDMQVVPVLNDLVSRGRIPEMTLAFLGHVSGAARHEDYTCNHRYAQFIGEEVAPWLKDQVPNLQHQDHLIMGLSLSGLMAVYVTLHYSQTFSRCLSQSGSHWWKHESFAQMAGAAAPVASRFWLSVGDQETHVNVKHPPTDLLQEISQIEGVKKAVQILGEMGGTVHYHKYTGTHSLKPWREELEQALPWLTDN